MTGSPTRKNTGMWTSRSGQGIRKRIFRNQKAQKRLYGKDQGRGGTVPDPGRQQRLPVCRKKQARKKKSTRKIPIPGKRQVRKNRNTRKIPAPGKKQIRKKKDTGRIPDPVKAVKKAGRAVSPERSDGSRTCPKTKRHRAHRDTGMSRKRTT